MKTATISTNTRGDIVALDSDGDLIAMKRTYCNPAALAQVICVVEIAGFSIDWAESDVAKPESADQSLRQFDYATDGVSGVLMAASLADAYRTMRARISDAQIADGATLWVGDKESGERITMSHGETL